MIKYKDIDNRSYRKRYFVQIPQLQSGTATNKYTQGFSGAYTHRFVMPFDAELERAWITTVADFTGSDGLHVSVVNEVKSATILEGNVYSACDNNYGVDLLAGQAAWKGVCAGDGRNWTTAGTPITVTVSAATGTQGFAGLLQFKVLDHTDKRVNKVDRW